MSSQREFSTQESSIEDIVIGAGPEPNLEPMIERRGVLGKISDVGESLAISFRDDYRVRAWSLLATAAYFGSFELYRGNGASLYGFTIFCAVYYLYEFGHRSEISEQE